MEQSLPAHLIFPIPTEMSWKKTFTKDVAEAQKNEGKEKKKTEIFVQENLKSLHAFLHM